jgi:hypothetical protein
MGGGSGCSGAFHSVVARCDLMNEYIHDEWCSTKLDGAPLSECDCVCGSLLKKDKHIADLERENKILRANMSKSVLRRLEEQLETKS